MTRRPAPPSGMPPPAGAVTPGGERVDLVALATRACEQYAREFPDERERYGPAGMLWCVHDIQHIANWAVESQRGTLDFGEQLVWLARVLEARDFPLNRLARGLEILAGVMRADRTDLAAAAEIVDRGAALIRSRPSFL